MKYFFFNDCIPTDKDHDDYKDALKTLVSGYKTLKTNHKNLASVVTSDKHDKILLTGTYTLSQCIAEIEDHDIKILAFALFSHSPSQDYLEENSYMEDVLNENFTVDIDGKNMDATNIAIVKCNDSWLFSLGICKDLMLNEITITGTNKSLTTYNLYGSIDNVSYIDQLIRAEETAALTCRQKIERLLGRCIWEDSFDAGYKDLNPEQQNTILDYFEEAEKHNILHPVMPNNKIIKDVTKEHSKKRSKVYELRIYQPIAMRIYFTEIDGCIRLLLIGKKSSGQDSDIARAYKMLE